MHVSDYFDFDDSLFFFLTGTWNVLYRVASSLRAGPPRERNIAATGQFVAGYQELMYTPRKVLDRCVEPGRTEEARRGTAGRGVWSQPPGSARWGRRDYNTQEGVVTRHCARHRSDKSHFQY